MTLDARIRASEEIMSDIRAGLPVRTIARKHFGSEVGNLRRVITRIREDVSSVPKVQVIPDPPPPPPDPPVVSEKFIETADELRIERVSTAHTYEEVIRDCKIDTSIWEPTKIEAGTWDMGYKDANKNPGRLPLYKCIVHFKRIVPSLIEKRIESLIEQAKRHAPVYLPVTRTRGSVRDCGVEVMIPDLHVGKLAWGVETGGRNYDTGIAVKRFQDSLCDIISSVDWDRVKEIVFPVGNDIVNSDNRAGMTEGGTPQDNDSRFHRVFDVTQQTLVCAIDNLRQYAPVKVLCVPGNHDRLSAWHICRELDIWYRNCEDIEVDASPTLFKRWRFGKCLVGFLHGDGGKRRDYPINLAQQWRKDWGETQFAEIHTGHLHTTRVEEFAGVRVRIVASLTEADAWHSQSRYCGNLPSAEAFIWHETKGLIQQLTYTVPFED